MIKTLSPHYKVIPWLSPSSGTIPDKYILELRIWTGLKASVPATAQFEIENINPLGRTGNSNVDISNYLNGFINQSFIIDTTTSLNDANSLVWVQSQVIYYISGVAQTPEFIEIDSAVRGYGYSMEGINPVTPTNNVLLAPIEQKVSRNSIFLFPFLASETVSTTIKLNTIELIKTATTNAVELVQSCYVKVSEFNTDYIEIYKNTVLITTLLITDEPRYDTLDIVFTNKEGQLQTITFFKEIRDSMKIEKEQYESSFGQPSDGVHQFRNYNVKGKSSFSANSGFVKEDNNEIFRQLLLAEKVWSLKDGIYTPLNLGTETIEYKTLDKDRLLNYKIDFDYAFNEINSI